MNSLVNANFNRTYNPSGSQNALSDIKRLLTSRDTAVQIKACEYVLSAICRHNVTSSERDATVGYLLDNDITVFLCEATSNLDLSLYKLILSLLRLLWRQSRFFYEEHAAHAMTAVLRALAHYGNSGSYGAVDCCLHFLCDLLSGVSAYQTIAPLSHQSAYSADQLLACLLTLAPRITTRRKTALSSALVLHSLISYQPEGLKIKGGTAAVLAQVLAEWFGLLVGALKHSALIGDDEDGGFYAVTCQLGMDALSLVKLLRNGNQEEGLVQSILADAQEMRAQTDSGDELLRAAHGVIVELVAFTKENQHIVPTQEYGGFLKFLLTFLLGQPSGLLPDFCDMLFSAGYLKMLPQAQIMRKDVTVRNISTLVLGELLKVLAQKHLGVGDADLGDEKCSREIQMGLIELQNGIERPQTIGLQLKQCQPYSLLIYIYFYSQSSDNPEEATAPLLPYLVEHILRLPKGFRPPTYIIKALWLVLAMATVSNGTPPSLDDRVRLERATDRFVGLLQPEPSVYYTHNPAILLWCFTSSRMVNSVRVEVLSQWLRLEDSLPTELSTQPITWDLLLKVLYQSRDRTVLYNTVKTLNVSLSSCEETDRQQVASVLWSMLPGVLSSVLIEWDFETETNVCYILELSTTLIPTNVDPSLIVKVAVLLSTIFSKTSSEQSGDRYDYECVCLKLSLYLLGLSYSQEDNRVLLTYINRPGFLPRVLSATTSVDDRVACAALQLLSYVVHYFVKSKYQPKVILEVETTSILKSLREDSSNDRGSSLLQLVYMILYSGVNTPLVLSYNLPGMVDVEHQYTALKALMFRVQMLCCKESTSQCSAAWKTLSSIFKHAIVTKNDTKLIEKLTTQLWLHTLINFTVTHFTITEEFLTFLNNWLTLLKITNKSKQKCVYQNSMFSKTTEILRKHLAETDEEDGLKELKRKVLVTVLEASDLNESYTYERRYLSQNSQRQI